MKIAISNIAWNKEEDTKILPILKKYLIQGVEVAPTKIWENPTEESGQTIRRYREFWGKEKILIPSIQAILFGHPELLIFTEKEKRQETFLYLEKMIKVSALLGAGIIVFGSPANRDAGKLSKEKILRIAAEFFYKIAEIAKKNKIFFCIEPNPKEYGTNFINKTSEAIELIKLVDHSHFRLHLDCGVIAVNKEGYEKAIREGFAYLQHFHVSERNLLPIGKGDTDHKKVAKILKDLKYDKWVSVEMRAQSITNNQENVEKALELVSSIYQ